MRPQTFTVLGPLFTYLGSAAVALSSQDSRRTFAGHDGLWTLNDAPGTALAVLAPVE
jgi:hypothetical protein